MDKPDNAVINYFKGSGSGTFSRVFYATRSNDGKRIKPLLAEDSFTGPDLSGKPASQQYQLVQNLHNKSQMICD